MERYITFKALEDNLKYFTKEDKFIILEYYFDKDWLKTKDIDEMFNMITPYGIIQAINEIMMHDWYVLKCKHIIEIIKSVNTYE